MMVAYAMQFSGRAARRMQSLLLDARIASTLGSLHSQGSSTISILKTINQSSMYISLSLSLACCWAAGGGPSFASPAATVPLFIVRSAGQWPFCLRWQEHDCAHSPIES